MQNEIFSSVLLNNLPGITSFRFQQLISFFGSAEKAVDGDIDEWIRLDQFDLDLINKIKSKFSEAKKKAEADFLRIEKEKISVFLWQKGPYPRLLKEIHSPPPIIFSRGNDIGFERPAIAIVGSRRCSYYGEKMARRLASELGEAGVTVVSGLARGIDTYVHSATLNSGGETWAVIGSGLGEIYPPENKNLAEKISNSGAVISEFPLNAVPLPGNFPKRNRIIAGLSLGVVVVEGHEKSGALITARLAGEEGREVFAVPGPATSALSAAPHRLLRLGAKMVESAADVIEELAKSDQEKLKIHTKSKILPDCETELTSTILSILGEEPIAKETLALRSGIECSHLSQMLLEMELRGYLKLVAGGLIVKT